MKERILENDSKAKVPAKWKPDTGWGKEARLLLEKDRRPQGEAEALISWAASNPFWKANILSMKKFREKYTTLKLQQEGEKEKEPKPSPKWDTYTPPPKENNPTAEKASVKKALAKIKGAKA